MRARMLSFVAVADAVVCLLSVFCLCLSDSEPTIGETADFSIAVSWPQITTTVSPLSQPVSSWERTVIAQTPTATVLSPFSSYLSCLYGISTPENFALPKPGTATEVQNSYLAGSPYPYKENCYDGTTGVRHNTQCSAVQRRHGKAICVRMVKADR